MVVLKEDLETYIEDHSTPQSPLFAKLEKQTYQETSSPGMLSGPVEGKFIQMLIKMTNVKHILEIGTFTGYSALSMASALPEDGTLTTCDIDDTAPAIGKTYWEEAGLDKIIDLRIGPALETISTLENKTFDLVFIDADKENYSNYWNAVLPLVKKGGLILVDNVLWSGKVLNPKDESDRKIVEFNTLVKNDDRVEQAILSIRDGITMARKL